MNQVAPVSVHMKLHIIYGGEGPTLDSSVRRLPASLGSPARRAASHAQITVSPHEERDVSRAARGARS
jgi:hypothetical protein